eukprot:Opistho-2@95620
MCWSRDDQAGPRVAGPAAHALLGEFGAVDYLSQFDGQGMDMPMMASDRGIIAEMPSSKQPAAGLASLFGESENFDLLLDYCGGDEISCDQVPGGRPNNLHAMVQQQQQQIRPAVQLQPQWSATDLLLSCEPFLAEAGSPATDGAKFDVALEQQDLWTEFHKHTTEMILTRNGRCLFPTPKLRMNALPAYGIFSIMLEFVPVSDIRWKYNGKEWVEAGKISKPLLTTVYTHPDSPNTGSHWMSQEVNFSKVKITNSLNNEGHIMLNSFQKYEPRFHIVSLDPVTHQPLSVETRVFPDTEFIAVTVYQSDMIRHLKKRSNPHASLHGEDDVDSERSEMVAVPCGKRPLDDDAYTTVAKRARMEASPVQAVPVTMPFNFNGDNSDSAQLTSWLLSASDNVLGSCDSLFADGFDRLAVAGAEVSASMENVNAPLHHALRNQLPQMFFPSEDDVKPVVNCKPQVPAGMSVSLCEPELWTEFHKSTTEMILTRNGRCLFPTPKLRMNALPAYGLFSVMLEFVPIGDTRWKYNGKEWVEAGKISKPLLTTVYTHPDSPNTGSHWMSQEVNFSKVKITNSLNNEGHIMLNSFQKYEPRFHIVSLDPVTHQPLSVETRVFPDTEFIAVTVYQSDMIRHLKKRSNPHASLHGEDDVDSERSEMVAVPCGKRPLDDDAYTTVAKRARMEASPVQAVPVTMPFNFNGDNSDSAQLTSWLLSASDNVLGSCDSLFADGFDRLAVAGAEVSASMENVNAPLHHALRNQLPQMFFPSEDDVKPVVNCKPQVPAGMSVSLCEPELWTEFHKSTTEMILTRNGRCLF